MSASGWGWAIVTFVGVFAFTYFGGFAYVADIFDDHINSKTAGNNYGTHTPSGVSANEQRASTYSNAIEPRNSEVRTYALNAIKKSNSGSYNIGQICDIYDKLYSDWVYVNDPSGSDYVASASESVRTLRGDCEDYAILMASLVESIGGSARIISAHDSDNNGHAYAEVYMSESKSDVQNLIDSMGKRYGRSTYHYHTDSKGKHWLNLDWTARHPGGEFYNSVGQALVIRSNGYHETTTFS